MILLTNKIKSTLITVTIIGLILIIINFTTDNMLFTLTTQIFQIFWHVFVSMLKVLIAIFGFFIDLLIK